MQVNPILTQSNLSVLLKMKAAINAHDIDAFANCFTHDFVSEKPVHPERNFTGAEQVRKNWTALFAQVPDLQAKLITHTIADNLGWSEWHWEGNQANGAEFNTRGVITWARLYMEPVQSLSK